MHCVFLIVIDSSLEPEIGVEDKKYDEPQEINNDENAGRSFTKSVLDVAL